MLQSRGVRVKSAVIWSGTTATWPGNLDLNGWWASYAEIYAKNEWVATVVDKLAYALARLPLKVYSKTGGGREEVPDHPYARLLAKPNSYHDPFFFWLWTESTYSIFGEAFWGKIRDAGGRPVELIPLHPSNMTLDETDDPRKSKWYFDNGRTHIDDIPPHDLVHFRTYNPSSISRGLSPLEPLRYTLANEDAARRAQTGFWKNGARPGVALTHPGKLSQSAAERLSLNWDAIAAGADATGKTVVLEEGMKPEVLTLSAEEAQYIESRKLNREEVCARYDIPPPVVHILDHATYANITEQMRSMYRDTMAPRLGARESVLRSQLRDAKRPGSTEPDFGDDVYAEFLLDEVLRGDFEIRAGAYQQAINSGWMLPAEVREKENLPFIEGSDQLFINSTMVPIVVQAAAPSEQPAMIPNEALRALMGRLSRQSSLDEVDARALVEGLNGEATAVTEALSVAQAEGLSVAEFRERLRRLRV